MALTEGRLNAVVSGRRWTTPRGLPCPAWPLLDGPLLLEAFTTGLADNIRKYEGQGGDGQKIIDKLVEGGHLPGPVKFNSDDRRNMQRHPLDYDEAQLREAGVWDLPALGEYRGVGTVGEVYGAADEDENDEEEGDEEEDEDEDDEEEGEWED